ncbi:uncharacterized protein Tco025E_01022 [Trypanosoma conorhini]|uniref:Uncharacterized protein n=1 Tax=Trypanosoma conorhini TaxID=83891 RepID=A0A3R7N7N5_9TRYP|nr:uncharacterized protein Tco025E_01022 [Trypanosoma conorhini]RNF26787.1 hypothetical protein Tco025E_01022 [Trypanosoma conorhini]
MDTDFAWSPRRARERRVGSGASGVGPPCGRGQAEAGDDALRLFLERARQRAAQRHMQRTARLESRYLRQLQLRLTLPPQQKKEEEEEEEGPAAARETRSSSSSPPCYCRGPMSPKEADVIEIELDESDENEDVEEMQKSAEATMLVSCGVAVPPSSAAAAAFTSTVGEKPTTPHSFPASFTPQSESNSQGLSPEVDTPFALASDETPNGHAVAAAKADFTIKYDNLDDTDAAVCATATSTLAVATFNSEKQPIDKFWGNSVKDRCAGKTALQSEPFSRTVGECDDEQQVRRCLMHVFGNHLGAEASQVEHEASPSASAKGLGLLDPELEEFLAWEEAKPLKRRESLQAGLKRGSFLAKVYAAAQPELDSSALFDAPGRKPAEPLVPECPASRYIQWIAGDLDCYEDLLLRLTPASQAAERAVVEGVCETVLNDYIAECVVDCLLHSCDATASS